MSDRTVERFGKEALASAVLTVEWLKQLLTARHGNALPAERLAFAELLYEKGVLDEAGLYYVRVGVEAEAIASKSVRPNCACPFCGTDCESCGHAQTCIGVPAPQEPQP